MVSSKFAAAAAVACSTAVYAAPTPAAEVEVCKRQDGEFIFDPDTPRGVPITGDYTGGLRPQIHYSPPVNFMNDPNGMFRDPEGVWHLYYQYNALDLVAGNQHWGHATSKDLYHWDNQPIAIFPPGPETYVFSGCVVVDSENTSGFFPDQDDGVVAMYTLAEYPGGDPGPQQQAIAYSYDGGYTFTPYEGNPVIASESSQFRDPKVIRYEDHWVMTIAYPDDVSIGVFTSPDLINWTGVSNFTNAGLFGIQYEVPNLVQVPHLDEDGDKIDDVWLMIISINPGAPLGGSTTQYFPGTFNGTHFEAFDLGTRISDFGKDNYAGGFFDGVSSDELAVYIGWASNWQYTQSVPTAAEGWRSVMTVPRTTYLVTVERLGWKLVSLPYDLTPVLGEEIASTESLGNGTMAIDYSMVESNALYWEAKCTNIVAPPGSATLNFTFISPVSGEKVATGFYFNGGYWVDRGATSGFDNPFFTDKLSTNVLYKDSWSMSGIIDRSILEVFLNGGVDSATNTFFPTQPLTLMVVSATDIPEDMEISISVRAIENGWAAMASEDGLVHGNTGASEEK